MQVGVAAASAAFFPRIDIYRIGLAALAVFGKNGNFQFVQPFFQLHRIVTVGQKLVVDEEEGVAIAGLRIDINRIILLVYFQGIFGFVLVKAGTEFQGAILAEVVLPRLVWMRKSSR